ncbi:hypothetical protein C440_04583 [Haloferax mucosum ATCC BAA-1512]|uniref:Uncharacterized protein n=2 Tax=Haloferax mucosum TaxID=403181 RepID=M0INK0_9EURY|nr:hypothetical protein C440_04583 [Haloferax mucosum ATCC BAA-1512]
MIQWRSYRTILTRANLLFLVAVFLPVAGLTVFDWSVVTLGTFVWAEAGLVLVWSALKSLCTSPDSELRFRGDGRFRFAGFTEKRGGIRVVSGVPPVYPRNFPNLFMYLFVGAGWLLFAVVFVIDSPFAFVANTQTPNGSTLIWLLAFSAVVCARHVFESLDVYVGNEQYKTHTCYSLNHRAIEYCIVLAPLVFLTRAEIPTTETLAWSLFGMKAGYELLRHRPGQLDHWNNSVTQKLGLAPTETRPTRLDAIDGQSQLSVPTDSRATLSAAWPFALTSGLILPYWLFTGLCLLPVVVTGGAQRLVRVFVPIWLFATAIVAVLFPPLKLGEYVLHYHWMEYYLVDTELVGYDRLLEQVQWRVERNEITEVAGVSSLVRYADRAHDTQTVHITTDDTSVVLAHLPTDVDIDELVPAGASETPHLKTALQ